jgi:signal transduction histidine kinase
MPQRSVLYIQTSSGREVVVLLEAAKKLSETDRALVEVFGSRLSIAFDNVILYDQLQDANSGLEERVSQRTRELTAANQRLASQWTRLQRANAFKSEILGTVAHDLKNPISVILGRTEMLAEMIGTAAMPLQSAQAQIGHIRDGAKRLTEMVNNLISDAMADALDITIRREPIDLAVLVKEVIEANRPMAARKEQLIEVSVPSSSQTTCDADRIREAIDNLLSNAIKYSPLGGRIEVAVERQADKMLIKVKDHGAGLSPEDILRLFGRFQRLSAKPTAGESSTGLGLSIVKRIVELHGGAIAAESAGAGLGTTFTLTLPAT